MCLAGELLDHCADALAQVPEERDIFSAGFADVGAADGLDARVSCWGQSGFESWAW